MVLINCKNKSCPFTKNLIPNINNPEDICCEILFRLDEGTEFFYTTDGRIQKSMYFEIQTDSKTEKEQKQKCLIERFGESNIKVFQNIPGTNPFIEWELTPEIILELNSCVEKLNNDEDRIFEILDIKQTANSCTFRKKSSNINEVWNIFISNRLILSDSSISIQDLNKNAIEFTIEDINEMNNEEAMEVFKKIATDINNKEQKK